jgi:hypothetical protein
MAGKSPCDSRAHIFVQQLAHGADQLWVSEEPDGTELLHLHQTDLHCPGSEAPVH